MTSSSNATHRRSPNQRWATDIATVDCGRDGWCAFVPVVDCCSREVLGWELAHTARAKTAERALEEALLHRFGTTRGALAGLTLRHDNGLVFGSRAYRALVRDYGLTQEPERSGDSQPKAARRASQRGNTSFPTSPSKTACASGWFASLRPAALPVGSLSPFGRLIRTFKEECAWQHRFDNLAAARATVARYIEHYNTQRAHSSLNYLTLCNPPHKQAT